jgi:hypothetical protein
VITFFLLRQTFISNNEASLLIWILHLTTPTWFSAQGLFKCQRLSRPIISQHSNGRFRHRTHLQNQRRQLYKQEERIWFQNLESRRFCRHLKKEARKTMIFGFKTWDVNYFWFNDDLRLYFFYFDKHSSQTMKLLF